MADFFQTLVGKPSGLKAGSREAINWFRESARNVQNVPVSKMFENSNNLKKTIDKIDIGKMYMYHYDPKLKAVLPYYDRLPLIILVDFTSDGFYGLNLHYLPPMLRAKLMDALYSLRNNDKYNETTKLKISYEVLRGASRFKYFAPCFKKYLFSHVKSNFLYIDTENWDKALLLPTERFSKATKDQVYKDSQSKF